jgi:hypothetical protein
MVWTAVSKILRIGQPQEPAPLRSVAQAVKGAQRHVFGVVEQMTNAAQSSASHGDQSYK